MIIMSMQDSLFEFDCLSKSTINKLKLIVPKRRGGVGKRREGGGGGGFVVLEEGDQSFL
jgi:hypothetical protein